MSNPTGADVAESVASDLDGTYDESLGRYLGATATGGILTVTATDPDTQTVTHYNAFFIEVAG